jgi:hypothetical protein
MKIPDPKLTIAAVLIGIITGLLSLLILYLHFQTPGFPLALLLFAPTSWSGIINRPRTPVISTSGLAWHCGWRGAMDWLRYPFSRVTIHLNAAELEALFGNKPEGLSNLNEPIRKLQLKTNRQTGGLSLSKRDVRRINRVAFASTTRPAKQQIAAEFLRRIFERSLGEKLDAFDDLFRKSNGVPLVIK